MSLFIYYHYDYESQNTLLLGLYAETLLMDMQKFTTLFITKV